MTTRTGIRRMRSLLVLALMVVPSCTPGTPGTIGHRMAFERLEATVLASRCDELPLPPDAAEAVTGSTRPDNEVHDCQRLVIPAAAGPTFGPLVGAYPLRSAMSIGDDAAFPAQGRAIATIFIWGTSPPYENVQHYLHLRIVRGWNCLFVRPTANAAEWDATIVALDRSCEGAPPPTGGWNLRAFRQPGDTATIPPTARWGIASSRHHLGIRCGPAWCTIGPPGTRPVPPGDTARNLHPGWYDVQTLAVERGTGPMAPGPQAYIYPTDTLLALRGVTDDATLDAIYRSGLDVATIEVHGPRSARGAYQEKFNLSDEQNVGRSTVWIRIGADTLAIFRNGQDQDTARLIYLPSTKHGAAGAVRWRWRENDETAWISCKAGCCDVVEP